MFGNKISILQTVNFSCFIFDEKHTLTHTQTLQNFTMFLKEKHIPTPQRDLEILEIFEIFKKNASNILFVCVFDTKILII